MERNTALLKVDKLTKQLREQKSKLKQHSLEENLLKKIQACGLSGPRLIDTKKPEFKEDLSSKARIQMLK